ncbi:MAG: LacI family DNA-binding transcriptional regulator [Lysobacterales bacterium]
MGKVTINEVSAAAGVSIKTVSRVLNNEPNVRPETRQRVQQAAEELNYRPSQVARTLAGRRSHQIALVYDNPSANYVYHMQMGAYERATHSNFRLLFQPCAINDPNTEANVTALIDETHVDGVILSPPVAESTAVIDAIARRKTPLVRIAPGSQHEVSPYVFQDDEEASREMTEYLIALGHQRIGFICGHPDHVASKYRLAGYTRALDAHGLQQEAELVVSGRFSFESGLDGGRRLLTQANRPTAIFASNDDMAAGVLTAAHELSLKLPEQLSVAGFDDTELADSVWPRLTTIRQPTSAMGAAAVEMLLELIETGKTDPKRKLEYRLIRRASTGPVSR